MHERKQHQPVFTGVKISVVDKVTPFKCGSCTATFGEEYFRDRHERMFHQAAA